jgi:hypothetical protein
VPVGPALFGDLHSPRFNEILRYSHKKIPGSFLPGI